MTRRRTRPRRIRQENFDSLSSPPWAPPATPTRYSADELYERRDPHGRASVTVNIGIPASAGVLFGVPAFLGLLLAEAELRYAAAGGLVVFTAVAALMTQKMFSWMHQVETWVRRDLDADGASGAPPPAFKVEVREKQQAGWRIKYADLPVDDDTMRELARLLLVTKKPYSRRALSDVLTQTQYEALSAALLKAGLLVDLLGNKRELTAAGRVLMSELLD